MENINTNSDANLILNYLHEYGMYIFMCTVFGFGSLIYYMSIKTQNPVFDSPKALKKKFKKEKPLRSKNIKLPSSKLENKEPVINIPIKQSDINIETEIDHIDDTNSDWKSVVKPKRITKASKVSTTTTKETHQEKDSCHKKTITLHNVDNKNVKSDVKTELKCAVKKSVCDKIESPSIFKALENVPIIKKQLLDKKFVIESNQYKDTEILLDSKQVVSESPTNSLSDDFEMLDVYKTSSEDGLKIDNDLVEEIGQQAISSTSGASRKKNKKQQKLISKQLIEAAAIGEEKKSAAIAESLMITKSQNVAKRKRPRKED